MNTLILLNRPKKKQNLLKQTHLRYYTHRSMNFIAFIIVEYIFLLLLFILFVFFFPSVYIILLWLSIFSERKTNETLFINNNPVKLSHTRSASHEFVECVGAFRMTCIDQNSPNFRLFVRIENQCLHPINVGLYAGRFMLCYLFLWSWLEA